MKFCFGDMVVVEDNLVGVVVKSWINPKDITVNPENREVRHEVYVRYFNEIREYPEDLMERYMVRHKYLEGEEITWQHNAVHNTISALDEPLTEVEQNVIKKLLQENPLEYKTGWNTTIGTIMYNYKLTGKEKTLCVRAYNAFLRARIFTLQDFFNKNPQQIKAIRNIGVKSLNFIIKLIYEYCIQHNIEYKYSIEDYNM